MKRLLYILAFALSMVACTDDIDKSNRFTFTGETMADYLLNRSEKYSHMITLLERADLFSLLNTYGQYTLFLPDNEAVERFLAEQDSIYWATKDTPGFINTGITSSLVEELSDSMANVIARTHLIETMHMMAEMGEGALPSRNFNYRFLGINYAVKGEQYYIMLNNSAAIIAGDNQVENGVVHIVDEVVVPSQKNVPELIGSYSFFSIFANALYLTGFRDSLTLENDDSYDADNYKFQDDKSFGAWVTSPPTRYYKYTGFIETDEVFRSYGINDVNDLRVFAEKWYGSEDRDSLTSPRNALHKFVAYHFVPREMPHNRIVPYGLGNHYWNIDKYMPTMYDRYDYFETMQGTMMKVVKPLSRPDGSDTFINYNMREVPFNTDMHRHLSVRVIPLTEFVASHEEYARFDQMATNGVVHPIDKILIYNENEMFGNILNERIRIDVLSLLPELQCNGCRYNTAQVYYENYLPNGYSKNLSVREGVVQYGSGLFMGGSIHCSRFFDFELTLPPLPSRVYEVRVGMRQPLTFIGVMIDFPCQVYIDGKVEGDPFRVTYLDVSSRWEGNFTGYVPDDETYDNGLENDKYMRLKGWMKAPMSLYTTNSDGYMCARDDKANIRRIITKKRFDGGRHKIRFRYIGEFSVDAIIDYLEFVPLHIVSDPTKPEDRY